MAFATDDEIRIAHDVLLKGERPFDEQRVNIIKEDSSCYVQACPGSGKTTALLAKLIILANKMPLPDGKGVCVLTHTNVAIDEIKAKLGPKADILFKYPNFFGTIQTFLHKYVTAAALHYFYRSQITYVDDDVAKAVLLKKYGGLEFGNKLKGLVYNMIPKEQDIEDNEIEAWGGIDVLVAAKVIKKKGPRSVKFCFLIGNYELDNIPRNIVSQIRTKKKNIINNKERDIILSSWVDWPNNQVVINKRRIRIDSDSAHEYVKLKEEMFKEGILSFDDAYDLAFRYIKEKNLDFSSFSDKRFQYLFLDEVQDCDKHQVDLIRKLFLDNKVVVQRFGDYCQAIYEDDDSDGAEIAELKGENVHYIRNSNRFGERIAKPLRTMCMEDNKLLEGNAEIYSAKPIIITYEEPSKVLPKYAELLATIRIPEMDNQSILEIANKEKADDPLHRINVKACGWVGKNVIDDEKRFIKSYFPSFERKKTGTKTEESTFDGFIPSNPQGTVKDYAATIIQGVLKFLDLCDVKNEGKRYNRTSLLAHLMTAGEYKKSDFLTKVMNWSMLAVKSHGYEDVRVLKGEIYQYLTNILLPTFGKGVSEEAISFFNGTPDGARGNNAVEQGNIFHGNGIDIEVATVHAVKGETHASTLYLETFYNRYYESERLSDQFKGTVYIGNDADILKSLRVAYVGMSRPRYLLCVAIQKDRFDVMDCEELRRIWDVENA